ncbi:Multidrug resistance protein MdtL [invertebrate metagenome]|uniref:Multidrug resistance protein MdtL n=1 Tax=invertebrate metagenome TaxID=1711999 RepID=A0A2H9T5L7_9ZZZZ
MRPETIYTRNKPAILLIALVLFSPMGIDIYLPSLPLMAQDFHINTVEIRDTITWFIISLGLGQLIVGPIADRYGRRPVAMSGIALYILGALLAYYAQHINTMLIARLIQGIGACATSVVAFSSARDCYGPQQCGRVISYLNGAICFIPALAPILGAWLTTQFGWRMNFQFMAAYGFITLILISILFKETRPANTITIQSTFSVSHYQGILKNPAFLFHAILCMLAMSVIIAYVTTSPVWLMVHLKQSPKQFTFWFSINASLNIIACILAPRFMDHWGGRTTLKSGLIFLTLGGILMLIMNNIKHPFAYMLPIFISSFGFAFVLATAAGAALAPFGDRAGTAAALLGVFQMTGSGILVSLVQRLNMEAPEMMALHMWLLIPGLIIAWTGADLRWQKTSQLRQ